VKKITLFLFSIFYSSPSFSQSPANRAAHFYSQQNYDSAYHYIERALSAKDSRDRYRLYKLKADIVSYQNQLIESIDLYQQAIWSIEKAEVLDHGFVGECYASMSWCYQYLGLLQESLIAQRKAKEYIKKTNNLQELATLYSNFGSLFVRLGKYDSAIWHFQKAQTIDIARSDSSAISSDLNNLGFLYQEIGEYEKAINYYHQSMVYLDTTTLRSKYAIRLSNIGMSELQIGEYDRAERNVRRARDIALLQLDTIMAAKRMINLGAIYLKKGHGTLALDYHLQAVKYFKQKGATALIANGLNSLAEAYLYDKNDPDAETVLQESLQMAMENTLLKEAIRSVGLLEKMYNRQGRVGDAYRALMQFHQLKDSLKQYSRLREIKNLEIKYLVESNTKEVELLMLNNELARQTIAKSRISLVALIGILVVLILAGTIIFYIQKQKSRLKDELLSKEIDELRLQINTFIEGKPDDLEITRDEINKKLNQPLTEREFEVLELALSDKNNREIAEIVFLSVNTIKFHLKHIYNKLGVSNRKEALLFVIKS